MTTPPANEFSRRYRATLRIHLRRHERGRTSAHSAAALGRAAVALGMDGLAVARAHQQAVAELGPANAGSGVRTRGNGRDGAGRFLLDVLVPVGRAERVARHSSFQLEQIQKLQRRDAATKATAQRHLREETARRKQVERQLREGAKHYDLLLTQARRMQDQSRCLAHQILSAQEEERKNISRELHDQVAQLLAGINVQLAALQEAAAHNRRNLPARIAHTQELVRESIEAVHRYARELRPALLDDLGLLPALRSFIRGLPARNGLRIRLTAFSGIETLDNNRRTVLYRVAQEALTNVVRHAKARTATVRIRRIENTVRLEVHDDGKSFRTESILNSSSHRRLGLLGMRERVEMVGGSFSVRSSPHRGTTVRAEITLPRSGASARL